MKDNSRIEIRGFNKTDRCVLAEWPRKINCILKHIRTENITDTNIFKKTVIVYVGKKIGLKACGSKNKKESEPWWKRRINKIDKQSQEAHKHLRTSPKRRDKEERKI